MLFRSSGGRARRGERGGVVIALVLLLVFSFGFFIFYFLFYFFTGWAPPSFGGGAIAVVVGIQFDGVNLALLRSYLLVSSPSCSEIML